MIESQSLAAQDDSFNIWIMGAGFVRLCMGIYTISQAGSLLFWMMTTHKYKL